MLLVGLGLATVGLIGNHNMFVAGDSASSGTASEQSECGARRSPVLATVSTRQILALRAIVQSVTRRAGGHEYESGTVLPIDAWADNSPENSATEGSRRTHWRGSFEVRQWAPDPQWGASYSDDIVVDAFMFPTPQAALRFFGKAASTRCRNSASTAVATRPADARELNWVNPDDATEEDLWLARGRVVYRLADVRPGASDQPPSSPADRVGFKTVEALACALPEARCS